MQHIAHNCILKKGCAIAACAQLSGGVIIGKNTWVGPNTSFREKVKIGNYNIIGIGAVIIRNTSNHTTWFGNPAKKLTKKKGKMFDYLEYKRILKKYKKINCDYKDVKNLQTIFVL